MEQDKPTKKWLEEQINSCQATILANTVVSNFCKAMIEKGIYMDEAPIEKKLILPGQDVKSNG